MIARPKAAPTVVLELPHDEAKAIVRALSRAETPITKAGNALDVQRLTALREGIEQALTGNTVAVEVES